MQLPGLIYGTLLLLLALTIPFLGVRAVRRLRDWARVGRWRSFLDRYSPYEVIRCLGMGREGIVFAVASAGVDGGEPRALKLLDSRDGRGLERRIELKERINAACEAKQLQAWPCLPAVYALDIIEARGHAVPFEEMELVHGETLTEGLGRGTVEQWTVEERLLAFDELLHGLHELSEESVNFVHIDPDNLMITEQRRFRLIDLSGFRLVSLTPRQRRRMFRRLARTFLAMLEDQQQALRRGAFGAEAQDLIAQLELYRDLPKGQRPPSELELFSIRELQTRIRHAFDLKAPSPC